jgi:hypothetical protein
VTRYTEKQKLAAVTAYRKGAGGLRATANLVHGWRRLERERRQAAAAAVTATSAAAPSIVEAMPFVPVTVTPSTSEVTIEIELRAARSR